MRSCQPGLNELWDTQAIGMHIECAPVEVLQLFILLAPFSLLGYPTPLVGTFVTRHGPTDHTLHNIMHKIRSKPPPITSLCPNSSALANVQLWTIGTIHATMYMYTSYNQHCQNFLPLFQCCMPLSQEPCKLPRSKGKHPGTIPI